MTRYLGPIRELDVELGILDDNRHPTGRRAGPSRSCGAKSRPSVRCCGKSSSTSAPVSDVKKLLRKLERVDGKENSDKRESRWRSVLATRLMRRAKALGAALEEAGPLYAPERIHGVRIRARSFGTRSKSRRNRALPASALIRVLKRHQDRLGRLHDFQTLLKHVRETEGSPDAGSRVNDLTAYAESLDQECRRFHADFVEHRDELANVVKEVRQQIVPALTTLSQAAGTRFRAPPLGRFTPARVRSS